MLRAYIHALPKVELHIHLVGSAGVDTVLALAARHPSAGVPTDRDDIHILVTGPADDLARQNVRYAEVTVTPYNHLLDGMSGDELLAGLVSGRAAARAEHGAERIGHGTSAAADPALLAYLAEHRVPVEVCPTSNVRTRQVPPVAAHPVRRLLDHGVVVTLNTDDPPMFGATLAVASTLGLHLEEVTALAANGVRSSFLPPARKAELLAEIAAVPRL